MADTVVIVNEFGEIGLDHHLIKQVTDQVMLLPNGCLCCTIRQDLVQTLRDLHRGWLAGDIPDFGRVLVETTGLAEPLPSVASLVGHPLLADVFALTGGRDGGRCRIRLAASRGSLDLLAAGLRRRSPRDLEMRPCRACRDRALKPNWPTSIRLPRSGSFRPMSRPISCSSARRGGPLVPSLACAPVAGHLAQIETVVLRPEGPVSGASSRSGSTTCSSLRLPGPAPEGLPQVR